MTKIFSPPNNDSKKRIAIRMPKEMYKSIISLLAADGKSSRTLSAWISDAITDLEIKDKYWEIIAEEWLDRGENISRPLSLTTKAESALEKMNAMYRCHYQVNPEINSKIIRTSVTQKLVEEEILK